MKYLKISFYFLIALIGNAYATPLPIEYFSSLPDVSRIQLSPDGKQLVSVIRVDASDIKGTAVQTTNLQTRERKMVLFTDNKKYDINWVRWKDSHTLLVGTIFPEKRDQWVNLSRIHAKTRETRLVIIDLDKDQILPGLSKAFLSHYPLLPVGLDAVVDSLPSDPENILMALPDGVYKVSVKGKKPAVVQPAQDGLYGWMTDRQHNVRLAYKFEDDGMQKVMVRKPGEEKFTQLWQYKEFSDDEVDPVGFGLDPKVLYIRAYLNKRLALFKVDVTDSELKRELVFANPEYDVNGSLVYSPITNDVVGFTYSLAGGFTFFDPELKKLQAGLNKALPSTKNYIVSFSDDLQKYLAFVTSDTNPGTYLLGQRTTGELNPIAYRYKNLSPDLMAAVKRYDYKARDGLNIEAYLTLPKDSAGKKLPTILFPHGGPIARDDDDFDYWVQYLANKGYAVLQMNFRGSSGHGLDFRNAGLKNWGKEMQDDIEDGARKLIADGVADENALCILGASYGGYAALMGVVKTPDLYKCAVSVAGVSNVYELVKDNRAFWRSYNIVDEQIGNDNAHLHAISPVNFADKIKVPVLLVHGDSDRQVDIKQSIEMRDALLKAGKNVTYLELPDEDHYLTNNENRVATFRAIDSFLDKYLPVAK